MSEFSAFDHTMMSEALRLAARGLNTTTPNPRVGCVLVKHDRIIGSGWHEHAGGPHAEVVALNAAGDRARGATVYVTLEPCSHHGRTPPCADSLVAAGVARVVAAMQDPNPLVAGQGLARLAAAGIETDCGLLEREAQDLNIGFVSRMTRARPWVRMKIAASLDGRTALADGRSQWITSPEARQDGHRWRARSCAILTGIGTVLHDDPQLSVRELESSRQPLRVVVDSRLEIPLSARVLEGGRVLVATAMSEGDKLNALCARGVTVVSLPDAEGRVDLSALMHELARCGINELHVEAGAGLNGALLHAKLVDELLIYFAPNILGDAGRGMFRLPPLGDLSEKHNLIVTDMRCVGVDWRVLARVST